MRNLDPSDLARTATVQASDSLPDCDPASVINGFVRDLPGKRENRWCALLKEGGVRLDLVWTTPQRLRKIQITFDTGFQRELTLTHQDSANKRVIRAPQPETVRDYELLYRPAEGQEWKSLGKITGNYQRLRRHEFAPFTAQALRLEVTASNGNEEARVYEIRCYA